MHRNREYPLGIRPGFVCQDSPANPAWGAIQRSELLFFFFQAGRMPQNLPLIPLLARMGITSGQADGSQALEELRALKTEPP